MFIGSPTDTAVKPSQIYGFTKRPFLNAPGLVAKLELYSRRNGDVISTSSIPNTCDTTTVVAEAKDTVSPPL